MNKVSRFFRVNKTLRQAVLPLGFFVVFSILLSSCDYLSYNNPFPDSYFSTNFISSLGFSNFSGIALPIPAPDPVTGDTLYVTGSWDFAYRYIDWDGFAYMTLNAITSSGQETAGATDYGSLPAGLAAESKVYRLELVNLITGGGFEEGISGDWSGGGSHAHDSSSKVSGTGSMKLGADSGTKVFYKPQMVSGFSSRSSLLYPVAFRFASDEEFSTKVGDENLNANKEKGLATGIFTPSTDAQAVSFSFEPESTGTYFSVLYVDDFTMTRDSGMSLRLQLKPSETTIPLEQGTYEFSVWVHRDPTATVDGSSGSYPLESLTVTMKAAGKATLAAKATTYTSSEGWTKVSATLSGEALQYSREEKLNDTAVLNLVIDLENAKPGSILLAAPELRFK